MIGTRLVFDGRKAREELGWRPQPFEQVLRETIAVLRQRGLLPAG
jgi:nucleoside-diphosphate-sugar epimerase